MSDLSAFAQRWFDEVWNKGREEAIHELYAVEGTASGVDIPGEVQHGPEAFIEFHRAMLAGFGERHFEVQQVIAEGNTFAARWVARFQHTGEFMGHAPTGRVIDVTGMSMCQVENGQIVKAWNNWDLATLIERIAEAE